MAALSCLDGQCVLHTTPATSADSSRWIEHKDFLDKSLALVNGSHPQAYANPVAKALQQLHDEVSEIISGFDTRLRQIRTEGNQILSSKGKPAETEGATPDVSILPIVDDGTGQGKSEEKVLQEVSDAILGRSEDEVVDALHRAEGRASDEKLAAHDEL